MERDYMKEIQDCSEKIGALKREKESIEQQLKDLFKSNNVCDVIMIGLSMDKLDMIEHELYIYGIKRDVLRDMYNFKHSNNYFKPMDEVDIRMMIDRNGSIRGILL